MPSCLNGLGQLHKKHKESTQLLFNRGRKHKVFDILLLDVLTFEKAFDAIRVDDVIRIILRISVKLFARKDSTSISSTEKTTKSKIPFFLITVLSSCSRDRKPNPQYVLPYKVFLLKLHHQSYGHRPLFSQSDCQQITHSRSLQTIPEPV